MWHYFVQSWSEELERNWRFAQFVFPLLGTTYLGLALRKNFMALPLMVLGLWKFGFPETLMYLYLAIKGGSKETYKRASDFLNGAGTTIHHASAAIIISMLVAGAIPPSRYIVGPILILLMQHWFVLLNYCSVSLYTAVELVLEYFFQWAVLCKLLVTVKILL